MSSAFTIVEHTLPGQHIRELVQSTRQGEQETPLSIAIKQYIPRDQPDPLPSNSVTILGFHGNGFVKEAYEPFFADLCASLRLRNVHVRGIWIADSSNQGRSGVLNEHIQGDQVNWFDHSRDVLSMVNHFRDQMPRPIIGVAHSFGCASLVHLSTIHPRLLSTVILMEPIIFDPFKLPPNSPNPSLRTLYRRDIWTSQEEATKSLSKAFGNWDPRALEAYIKHGLRKVPTALYNNNNNNDTSVKRSSPSDKGLPHPLPAGAVTLTTTKAQESWTYVQYNGWPAKHDISDAQQRHHNRLIRADQAEDEWAVTMGRPECRLALEELRHLRPSALFVYGGKSMSNPPPLRREQLAITGTWQGGNGGAKEGKVKAVVIEQADHLVVFEKVGLGPAVNACAEWLDTWFQGWLADEEFMRGYLARSEGRASDVQGLKLSQEWVDLVKKPMGYQKPTSDKAKL